MRRSESGFVSRNDLVEGFLLANHAEIRARAFLGGSRTLFQVNDFGIEGRVAIAECVILQALPGNRGTQVARLAVAVVSQPELSL